MPPNIIDHRGLAQDDLRDGVIQNIASYLGQVGIAGAIGAGLRTGRVAATAAINTTETLLVSQAILPPSTVSGNALPGTLQAGSQIRVTIGGTTTSTNADVSTFALRMGILGTTADASVATWTVTSSGSGTNVVFIARLDITVRVLATSGANGTGYGVLSVQNTGATGLVAVTNTIVASAAAITAMPTLTATFIDITYVSAATTTTTTFQTATIEVIP
jgi:hypothetical protein